MSTAISQTVNEDTLIKSAMHVAMNELIDVSSDESVGGFAVPVGTRPGLLKYMTHGGMYGAKKNQVIPSGKWATVQFAGIADGGYGYAFLCPEEIGLGAVGVHIKQVGIGILFYPLVLRQNYAVKKVSHDQFVELVKRNFGITLSGVKLG